MLLEVCVDTIAGAQAALSAGAHRIELCAALSEGGLTPSHGMMRQAASLGAPIAAMIRPRGGDFRYSPDEIAIMRDDIMQAREIGIGTVVFGALDESDGLDIAAMRDLIEAAEGLSCTLHRAFDLAADPILALEQAIELGFDRILTSGQAPSAIQGVQLIEQLASRASGRISIMPGAGVTAANAVQFASLRSITEIHASCSRSVVQPCLPIDVGRSATPERRETDPDAVRALLHALSRVAD